MTPPIASSPFLESDTLAFPMPPFFEDIGNSDRSKRQRQRGKSVDITNTSPKANSSDSLHNKSNSDNYKDISPMKFCGILTSTSSTQLDIEVVKKLRLLLRNESAR